MSTRPPLFAFLSLALAACATQPTPSTLLRAVKQINPDGARIALADPDLSPFQRYIRNRLPRPPAAQVQRLLLLEVDLPAGQGDEGAYMVVAFFPGGAQLEYFEQIGHAPRNDRYFHRRLQPDESAAVDAFLRAHLADSFRVVHPTAPASPPAADPAEQPPEDILFRFTDALPKEATTLLIPSPGEDDHPAIDLVELFAQLRDRKAALPLQCTYILAIPVGTDILFADPQRRALDLWYGLPPMADAPELRAQFFPPLDFDPRAPREESAPPPQPTWYAYINNEWTKSDPPPPPPDPAPEPTPTPATAPATEPAATSPFSDSGLLPHEETWRTETGDHHTTVWHFQPLGPNSGQWLGFVVPVLTFDLDHMQVDPAHNRIYLIHDGQLMSLPIPPNALRIR